MFLSFSRLIVIIAAVLSSFALCFIVRTSPVMASGPCPVVGDTNTCDGIVDIRDFTYLSTNFGSIQSKADLNSDGLVNILDYSIISLHFGESTAEISSSVYIDAVYHPANADIPVSQAKVKVYNMSAGGSLVGEGLTNQAGRSQTWTVPTNSDIDVYLYKPSDWTTNYCGSKWSFNTGPYGNLYIRTMGLYPTANPCYLETGTITIPPTPTPTSIPNDSPPSQIIGLSSEFGYNSVFNPAKDCDTTSCQVVIIGTLQNQDSSTISNIRLGDLLTSHTWYTSLSKVAVEDKSMSGPLSINTSYTGCVPESQTQPLNCSILNDVSKSSILKPGESATFIIKTRVQRYSADLLIQNLITVDAISTSNNQSLFLQKYTRYNSNASATLVIPKK